MEAEPDGNSRGDCALPGTIRAEDHVEMRTGMKLDEIIGHEVLHLDASDRSSDKAETPVSFYFAASSSSPV